MRRLWFFTKHELSEYFSTPIPAMMVILHAVGVAAHALFVVGWLDRGLADLGPVFSPQPWALCLLIAALSAALWTGNQESETFDLLLSDLIRPWHAVFGKFLAAWSLVLVAIVPSVAFWGVAAYLGEPDNGAVIGAFLMLTLLAAAMTAVGISVSLLSINVAVAFAGGFVFLVGLTALSWVRDLSTATGDLFDILALFSPLDHFTAAAGGVLALSDAVFFLSICGFAPFLAILVVRRRMGRAQAALARGDAERVAIHRRTGPHHPAVFAVYLLGALAVATAVNGAALRLGGDLRLDVTEEGMFSLDGRAPALLGQSATRITLRLFHSPVLSDSDPGYAEFLDYARLLMRHYGALGDGTIRFETYRVEAGSESADLAAAFGLEPIVVPGYEHAAYFGIVGSNGNDDVRIMPLLTKKRERFLALDMLRMIVSLAQPKPVVIGLLSPFPTELPRLKGEMGTGLAGWQTFDLLRRSYVLKPLAWDMDRVPDDVDALVIVHPVDMPDKTRYAVDQYVMKGGRAALFVDPWLESPAPPGVDGRGVAPSSNAQALLAAWGVSMAPYSVIADPLQARARRAPVEAEGGAEIGEVLTRPHWLSITADNLAQGDPVTGGRERINLDGAGVLTALSGRAVTVEPLIRSTVEGYVIEASELGSNVSGETLAADGRVHASHIVAARIKGEIASAFPDGLVEGKRPDHLARPAAPVDLIVVSDVDWLSDRAWLPEGFKTQGSAWKTLPGSEILSALPTHADNARFLFALVDDLAAPKPLREIEVKALNDRRFDAARLEAEGVDRIPGRGETALLHRLGEIEGRLSLYRSLTDQGLPLSVEESTDFATLSEQAEQTQAEIAALPAVAHERADRESAAAARRGWAIFWTLAAVPGALFLSLIFGYILHSRGPVRS